MTKQLKLSEIIPDHLFGKRLDQVLAEMFPDYSRSRIKEWILADAVAVNGQVQNKPREKVLGGEQVDINAELPEDERFEAEAIDLNIVYEDEHIMVINKPAGLVVHPGAGNADGTLLNALLHHCPGIGEVPRAGIVHRLDKETSGLMVVARTDLAQTALVRQLQERTVGRRYLAWVWGTPAAQGKIQAMVARDQRDRLKMAVHSIQGKPAITLYRRLANGHFAKAPVSLLECRLETGRTHQIRVHLQKIGHPILGDDKYGLEAGDKELRVKHLFLHAHLAVFSHPKTSEKIRIETNLPKRFHDFLAQWDSRFLAKNLKPKEID